MPEDLFIRPDFDNSGVEVSFTAPRGCSQVEYAITGGGKVAAKGRASVNPRGRRVAFREQLPGFTPWTVEHPFLYSLRLELRGPGKTSAVRQNFGMRKIHVRDKKLFFNNRLFHLRGHIRGREAHDHPNLSGLSLRGYHEKNIRMAKLYGFNFVRFHSTVPPDEFFEAADRLGMLCHVEIRKYYGKYQKERTKEFESDQRLVDEEELKKVILRLRNHPSLMVYCLGNEINSPGNNPRVKYLRSLVKKLDPTRLFLDTCSRGEYDRDTADIDVQHMSYFAPFGRNYDMFADSIHLSIYGSVSGARMTEQDDQASPKCVTKREIPVNFPLIAHEVCHYLVLRDPYRLDEKFTACGAEKPWWIDELKKMIRAKGHRAQFRKMLAASTRFQYIWTKQALESVRRSPLLQGFHFLQLADTDRYENANGLLDCFDDPKDIPPEKILPFNGPTVLIADLPRRTFMGGEHIKIPLFISHYPETGFDKGSLVWKLKKKGARAPLMSGRMDDFDLSARGNRRLCRIELKLPEPDKPIDLDFSCTLRPDGKKAGSVSNRWDLWLFPDRPSRIEKCRAAVESKSLKVRNRYPRLTAPEHEKARLMISESFSQKVIRHLEEGKDALVIYRSQENRSRTAPREKYCFPSTWERFKGVIWDRGHNCGGFTRRHPILRDFPCDGLIDWQFYNLIEDSDKLDIDDFPADISPIIEGVDKAVRDRFDVNRFGLPEFQYAYTMRKFAYLFEIKVGKGRLIATGMNFSGIEDGAPESCWMFESIISYMCSNRFSPKKSISPRELSDYLLGMGRSDRIKERMMTQYWQLDEAPLESKQYWAESERWLRKKG